MKQTKVTSEQPSALSPQKVPWGVLASLAVFVGFIGVQFLTGMVLGLIAALTGLPEAALDSNFAVAGFYLLSSAFSLGFLSLLLKFYGTGWDRLGLRPVSLKKLWVVPPAFLVYFLISGSILALMAWLAPGLNLDQAQDLGFGTTSSLPELGIMFVALVLITPLTEEMLFRGFMLAGFKKRLPVGAAIVLSSLLFGAAHFQLNIGLDTFGLALVLGWLYNRSGNLWPSVALHMVKNLIAFAIVYL